MRKMIVGRCEYCGRFVAMRDKRQRVCSHRECKLDYKREHNQTHNKRRNRTKRLKHELKPCPMRKSSMCTGFMPSNRHYGCQACFNLIQYGRTDDNYIYSGAFDSEVLEELEVICGVEA
jgi:hypothetical protein